MFTTVLQIVILLLLILANGFFAMSELAVVAARKSRLEQLAQAGHARAKAALALANNPNRFLATLQVGVTFIGIIAGAYGGVTLAEKLVGPLSGIAWLAPYSRGVAVAIVVILTSFFTLVLGELVPKRLALNSRERMAMLTAPVMQGLAYVSAPLIWLLGQSTEAVLRLLRVRPSAEPPITEEEIALLLEQGTQAGVFEAAEQDMVESVFRLGDRQVARLMTPRPDIVWLDAGDPPEEIARKLQESGYSRFPVGEGNLDNLLGVAQAKDLLVRYLQGGALDLGASLRAPLYVPENLPAPRVLEAFKSGGTHLALVVDEYGSIQGLVTLNDVMQAIVGEAATESAAEPEAMQREDGSWLLDGMLPVDELEDLLGLAPLPEEERGRYHTLGGFVMAQMGRIPQAGDYFDWGGWRFEVMDMDGHRVDKVLATPPKNPL
ncbi:MAG: HlyC/CorC family transporter [candidate division WS1 bacterium]|nr:HlyC/CorC family transporter [candidate division WS1 bacterium]